MEPTLDFQSSTAPFSSTSLSTSVTVIIPATSSPSSTQSQSQSVGGGEGGSDMSLATPLAPEFVFSGLLVVSLAGLWWRQRRVRRAGDVQVEEERRREERRRNARLGARPRLLDARVETVDSGGEAGRQGWRWRWREVMPISAAYTRSLSISPLNAVDASTSLPSESDIRRRSARVSRISLRSNSRTVEDTSPETPARTPPPTPPPTPIPRLDVAVLISMPHPRPRALSHTSLRRHSNNNIGQLGSGSLQREGEVEASSVRLNEVNVEIPIPIPSSHNLGSTTRIRDGLGNLDVSLEIGVSNVDVFEG
ncbi:uncharacterized protein FOMMEDRAFT_23118 [Fomitiporia mediterranea MF3/22]|uniref:uncharacterized protein n=1 Tax=Fomitiporia mediterranea (strain MF3/22) TaxID=694068 RepID=UPI00044081E8|nr:uncharacterized protein FOMMEDRAFT_23118 [Fomitiporia mediterranea MF3/22]EJC99217.1 hypothetical protein FOMMEDRAFT_23118 [Fomitiporia mediterranea MF3/22]